MKRKLSRLAGLLCCLLLLLALSACAGSPAEESSEAASEPVTSAEESAAAPETEGAVPDGLYTIGVNSNAEMFRVVKCILHVREGKMTAVLTMSGTGYGYLYPGTGAEADAVPQSEWIPSVLDEDGAHTFALPIEALDTDTAVASWSIKYEKWYDRTLQFLSGSLQPYDLVPKDGSYTVDVESDGPAVSACALSVKDGVMTAELTVEDADCDAVFAGTAAEAVLPGEGLRFTVEIPSLDKDVAVAFHSASGNSWTDHVLYFDSTALAAASGAVPEDGVYTVDVTSDSALFTVAACTLTVKDGVMTACVTAANNNYGLLYIGLAKDALQAAEMDRVAAVADASGSYTYTFVVPALGSEMPVAVYSESTAKWYDRTLTFRTDSLVSTGEEPAAEGEDAYTFSFTGGSGRVTISCAGVEMRDGTAFATIVFSSSNYTYAEVNGEKYFNTNEGGDSTFVIPVVLNGETPVSAETVAMGSPHVVDYVFTIYEN
jgi:major membrane immunogen (membrane-anchored lipoprotein)